ncbi:RNA-directed DNA polymerase from mobile element jockey [Plakobranchus ocellatus]|uniref:RNA-directed DNA polymerase from mobile element jockey n=1 Tax=Plakobranchus ocellatus TaxID=259542 RepID=A0AAV3YEQ9_9GAST|nr:RNA-directed DNA polymerase from mobile element jockey [Plakobranchus ocellatus]
MAENDLIILNSGKQTFVHSAYHSISAIDLAVASPSIAAECSWAAHSDLCGNDHFPLFLTLSSNFNRMLNTSFNFQNPTGTVWRPMQTVFGRLCGRYRTVYLKLHDAARSSIPLHKGTKCKTCVP